MTNIFTCIGRGHGAPALPATRQEWEAMRREPWLAEMCRRIEAGDEKLKRRLPIWTPHCAAFRDNHRAAADALKPLSRLMLDFDEKGHSTEILERSLALQKEGKWQVLLVEESVRRGTHVLIVLPDGMTPQEAQKRFSADVGFQADGALKDVSRCIYMVPEDHTLYVDEDKLFGNEELTMDNEQLADATPCHAERSIAEPKHLTDAAGRSFAEAQDDKEGEAPTAPLLRKGGVSEMCFKGVPYSQIIQQWFRLAGGEPVQGERNDKLHRLASHLRYIADNDEALLLQVMPRYGLSEEEMKGLIHSACSAKWYSMPKMMREALENEERKMKNGEWPAEDENSSFRGEADILHSSLPKRLPALIKLLVSRTPDVYKAAVAHAVFPSLGAHLHRVRFRYIDNVEHEATPIY